MFFGSRDSDYEYLPLIRSGFRASFDETTRFPSRALFVDAHDDVKPVVTSAQRESVFVIDTGRHGGISGTGVPKS